MSLDFRHEGALQNRRLSATGYDGTCGNWNFSIASLSWLTV